MKYGDIVADAWGDKFFVKKVGKNIVRASKIYEDGHISPFQRSFLKSEVKVVMSLSNSEEK